MKKKVGLDEKVKIAGRTTTIREEAMKGTGAYTFTLGTKTAAGSRIDRCFINVYKSPTGSEEFDVSKEDFEWLQTRGIRAERATGIFVQPSDFLCKIRLLRKAP